ncbi:MAG TPA: hypothetical protein VL049_19685 [Candidatus Dormibacteraeota bacterium]|nr:hypothetical protein [Candidatus Dormibacteraeota bacterium]
MRNNAAPAFRHPAHFEVEFFDPVIGNGGSFDYPVAHDRSERDDAVGRATRTASVREHRAGTVGFAANSARAARYQIARYRR